MYHKRYGVLYTQKLGIGRRKLVCMDLKLGRILHFYQEELEGNEIEDDLKEFISDNLNRLNEGYWDYTGDPSPKVNYMIQNLNEEKATKENRIL
jgi:hypothetical protein